MAKANLFKGMVSKEKAKFLMVQGLKLDSIDRNENGKLVFYFKNLDVTKNTLDLYDKIANGESDIEVSYQAMFEAGRQMAKAIREFRQLEESGNE